MGPHYIVIITAFLLASVTYSIPAIRSLDVKQNDVPKRNLFRATLGGDEESAISWVEKLTDVAKSGFEARMLKSWLDKKKSAANVMAKLKLSNNVYEAIASPNLNTLIKYLDMFSKQYPDSKVSLLGALTRRYGDVLVAKALEHAKQFDSTKDIATKLQAQQLESWLNSKKTAEDVFRLLRISNEEFLFVVSQKLETLNEYIHLFNGVNPHEKTNLFRVLVNGFGGEDRFALIVDMAMFFPGTAPKATRFQDELFHQWLERDLDPMSVFTQVFKLDETNLAAAGNQHKAIVNRYKTFYRSQTGLFDQVPRIVDPRRS